MLTKGIILGKTDNSYQYMVRIPILESSGNSSVLDDETSPTLKASVCYGPGMVDAFNIGDIVFVSFEDNNIENVVILGKLYQGDNTVPIGYAKIDKLYVNSDTELRGNVSINGVDVSMIEKHNQAIDNLFNIADAQSQKTDLGDWTIQQNKDSLVLNFFRKKK